MKENRRLKKDLIIQSFSLLFILLFIKHFNLEIVKLTIVFLKRALAGDLKNAAIAAMKHNEIWNLIISVVCIIWVAKAILIFYGFKGIQSDGFRSRGETISICEEQTDAGATFLVSFILPLLIGDITNCREFIFFITLLFVIILLLTKTNLFYQNPVLVLLGYRVFKFRINNPASDIEHLEDRVIIGITRGQTISEDYKISYYSASKCGEKTFIKNYKNQKDYCSCLSNIADIEDLGRYLLWQVDIMRKACSNSYRKQLPGWRKLRSSTS